MTAPSRPKGTAGVLVSLAFMVVGILMILIPSLAGMDGMNGGFALGFVGFFLILCGFISWLLFRKRRKIHQRMEAGDIVARFPYAPHQWQKMIAEEVSGLGGLKVMGIVLGSIFAVIGIIGYAADEDLALFFIFMLALGAFFAAIGFLSYGIHQKRLLRSEAEAVITRDGVRYMGELYDWNGVTSVLDAVGYHPRERNTLVFVYRQLSGRPARMRRSSLSLPIPEGMDAEAAQVVQFFSLPLSEDVWKDLKRNA